MIIKPVRRIYSRIRKNFDQAKAWIEFFNRINPRKAFEELPTPAAPDYSDKRYWAAWPGEWNKSRFAPPGFETPDQPEADVFFLHPTTYFGNTSWNAPFDHIQVNEIIDEVIMAGQASVFNGSCRIYAPRYRQATFYTFLDGTSNGRKALNLAYADIKEAFMEFQRERDSSRPFFLAGHSQGALHTLRLLEEMVEGQACMEQFVAAYPLGFWVPEDKFKGGHFKQIKPAQTHNDIQTLIAWDTYGEQGKPRGRFDKGEHWYTGGSPEGTWERRLNKKPVSINPLSWNTSTNKANARLNKGAIHIELDSKKRLNLKALGKNERIGLNSIGLSNPFPAEVSARIGSDGFLYVSWPRHKRFKDVVLPGKNLHNYDYSLFYLNLRENVGGSTCSLALCRSLLRRSIGRRIRSFIGRPLASMGRWRSIGHSFVAP